MLFAQNAHLIGACLALLCLIRAFRSGRRRWLVENLPTSKSNAVRDGLVEVKGIAEPEGPPLCSELTQQACVYYKWRVEEKWSCLTTEDGKLERDDGWQKMAGGERMIPFRLKDDCGSVLVRPEGAKVEGVLVLDKTCNRNDPLYYSKGPTKAVAHSDHQRRFYEIAIPLGQQLYVVGRANQTKDPQVSEIAHDSRSPMFLISAWAEAEVCSRLKGSSVKWLLGGVAILVAGLLLRDIQALQIVTESWPVYAIMIPAYALAAFLTLLWIPSPIDCQTGSDHHSVG